jgi:hypothetical protein
LVRESENQGRGSEECSRSAVNQKAIGHYHFLERERCSMVKTREREGKFVFMPLVDKVTRRNVTSNIHITTRHVRHLVRRYGEQLFLSDILKMKKENPSLGESQIRNAFRLTPA